jgi:hypothetical protein
MLALGFTESSSYLWFPIWWRTSLSIEMLWRCFLLRHNTTQRGNDSFKRFYLLNGLKQSLPVRRRSREIYSLNINRHNIKPLTYTSFSMALLFDL